MTEPIARIEAALGRLGAEHEPPAGWEARVLAATTAAKPKPKLSWWYFALPAAALAVIAVVAIVPPSPEVRPFQVALTVKPGGSVPHRDGPSQDGKTAHIGDVVHVDATGGGLYQTVWIYRNDKLVMGCPGDLGCQRSDGSTSVEFPVKVIGEYKVVVLTSKSPLPAPTGTYDADVVNVPADGTQELERFSVL